MRLVRTTKVKEMVLSGIAVNAEIVDGAIRGVSLTDGDGGYLRFVIRNYNELYVEIPEPVKMVKRWKLAGTVIDLSVEKYFDTEREADQAKDEYLSACDGAVLEISEIEVPDPESVSASKEIGIPF